MSISNRPYRAVAIFARMRTGSNLLERSMGRHPDVFTSGELFNRAFISGKFRTQFCGWTPEARNANPMGCLDAIADSDPRLLLFRIFPDHMPDARAAILARSDIHKVILTRPYLESFLSLEIARATDQWLIGKNSRRVETPKITFDPVAFKEYSDVFAAQEASLRADLKTSGQGYSEIAYHDLQNVDKLNALGECWGLPTRLVRFISPIDKQNAGDIRDLVTNVDALTPHIDQAVNQPFSRGSEPPIIPKVAFAEALNLVFCPMKGNHTDADCAALKTANGAPLIWIKTSALQSYPFTTTPLFYTRFVPPLERAYLMFIAMIEGKLRPWNRDPFEWLLVRSKADFPNIPRPYNLADGSFIRAGYNLRTHKRNFLMFLREFYFSLWINSPEKLPDDFLPQLTIVDDLDRFLPKDAQFEAIMGWGTAETRALNTIGAVNRPAQLDALFDYDDVIGPNHIDQIRHLYGEDIRQLPFPPPREKP